MEFLPVELNRFAGEAIGLRDEVPSSSRRGEPFPLLFGRRQGVLSQIA